MEALTKHHLISGLHPDIETSHHPRKCPCALGSLHPQLQVTTNLLLVAAVLSVPELREKESILLFVFSSVPFWRFSPVR